MALTQVKTAGIANDAVTGAKIADDQINSEHYVDGSIDNAHVADDQINSEHYHAASIDHEHLANDCVDGDNIADDSIGAEHIADNAVGLAAMAGLARGKIIYGDASGDPAALAVGSANQVLTSDGTDISWAAAASGVGGATGVDFNDTVKARWGTGNDLEIHHSSNGSYIKDTAANGLRINSANFGVNNAANDEQQLHCVENGAVSLFHNGTKQVETDANGLQFDDGKGLTFGTDDDLTVKHNSADTTFLMTPAGHINFHFDGNDATTAIPIRFEKIGDAVNSVRHSMFSFGLPGSNNGVAQCGSSTSEAPIWGASSDYRIKENFRAYTGGWDVIKAIPVQLYDEKSPSYIKGVDKKDRKGWKAHEVQAVIPEAVTGTKDEVVTQALIDAGQYQQSELNNIIPQQLGTTAMLPDVIGALQQAMAKIETLETKVAALEAG